MREGGGSEGRRGEGVREGEGREWVVREGCWALVMVCGWWWWVFIAIHGGGHLACLRRACLSFAGAYHCPWWWVLDLPSSFLSRCDVAANGWGRGEFMPLGLWSAVFVGTGHCLCYVWLLLFVGWWQLFVGQLSSPGSWGCFQWWGLHDVAWGRCVDVDTG